MKFLRNSPVAYGQTLRQPSEQNRLEVTRTRPVSARDAPGRCSKTSSTTSTRSSRAHNPSGQSPRTRRAATCDGDAPESCKSPPRNSPGRAPTGRRQPRGRTKVPRPAGRPTLRPSERVLVCGYSQRLDTTPIVPHLDASQRASVARCGDGLASKRPHVLSMRTAVIRVS